MIEIRLDPSGSTVSISLTEYLGDKFPTYRNTCYECGAIFVADKKLNRLPVDGLPQLLALFQERGLTATCEQAVADRLSGQAAEATAMLEAGRERLRKADERLAGTGRSPFPFQRTGVEWLSPRKGALLGDEMGLGKTVQALLALPEKAFAMVLVPKNARAVWENECRKWRPDLRPVVIASALQFRWPRASELLIVTYGCLPAPVEKTGLFAEEQDPRAAKIEPGMTADDFAKSMAPKKKEPLDLGLPLPPVGMVLMADEAHNLKNPKAQRTQRSEALLALVVETQGYRWLITGTPLLNRPPELAHLLKLAGVFEEAFGTWGNFMSLFNGAKQANGFDWGKPDAEVPERLRRVMLRRNRSEVMKDLPRKMRTDMEVSINAEAVAVCDEVVAAMKARGIDIDDVKNLTLNAIPFEMMSRARSALAAAKTPDAIERIAEYEEEEIPLIVFSDHRTPIDALANRPGWAVITGDVSADERGRIQERFQAGELKGIAGTYGAMGTAMTLTHAAHVLLVDCPWTPALISQAEDRACRIGQKAKSVNVERLVANHQLDHRVLELLTIKQEIIEASVEASGVPEDYEAESPAAKLAAAANAAQDIAADLNAKSKAREEAREQQKKTAMEEAIARIPNYDGRRVKVSETGRVRSAGNAVEDWAHQGILALAGMDPDRAREVNEMGFSKFDGEFGHSLADQLGRNGMLSDKQWAAAIKLATKYRRQVGPPPVLAS